MDICLNVEKYIKPKPIKVKMTEIKGQNVKKKKVSNKSSIGNNFSFTFVKNDTVKAVVARKRPAAITKSPETIKREDENLGEPVKKNYVFNPNFEKNGKKEKNESNEKTISDKLESANKINGEITLNITDKIDDTIFKSKAPKKLNRAERLKLQKAKRIARPTAARVLTEQEIDNGLKKFSRRTNKTSQKPQKTKSQKSALKQLNLFINNPTVKVIGQRLVKPLTETIFTGAPLSSVGLHPFSVKNLSDMMNITQLTRVQQMTIPRALEGKDILVRSQTGSGKTLAYALPIVQKLQEKNPKITRQCGIKAVVVVPTRELVIQTYELFVKLLKAFTWIVPGMLIGGEKRKSEKARLRKGINILVGTPGRLCDHILHTENFKLDATEWLILDEGDRLLEMGYERDVKIIVDAIKGHNVGLIQNNITTTGNPFRDKEVSTNQAPAIRNNDLPGGKKLQTLLLSATLTSAVQRLAGLTLVNPLFIDTSDENFAEAAKFGTDYAQAIQNVVDDGKLIIPDTIDLNYILVPPKLRLVTLSAVLVQKCVKEKKKALVFMSTMDMVTYHSDLMNEVLTKKVLDDEDEERSSEDESEDPPLLSGVRFFKLHGSMTQCERSGVFKAFRDAKAGVLLATDVAGRGIDVPEVDLVVQYSPPRQIADFVHRVGRTARAGRSGQAILFLGPNDTEFVRILEDKRIRISQGMMEVYLNVLVKADSSAHNIQEAASNLQHKFESLINEDKEMREKGCKAYVSWVKFYSTFPKGLKHIFNVKNTHMGHYAKSFGLRESPTSFTKNHMSPKPPVPTNRLTFPDRTPIESDREKPSNKRGPHNNFKNYASTAKSLTISEFDSGLPPMKKKKK